MPCYFSFVFGWSQTSLSFFLLPVYGMPAPSAESQHKEATRLFERGVSECPVSLSLFLKGVCKFWGDASKFNLKNTFPVPSILYEVRTN